ncbi:MAG: antirestriction protein ArdA [Gammaproteobacteria bacterium]
MYNIEPKIYVACLAAYNCGYLHGAWIDAIQDVDSLYKDVKKMLASSPIPNAEEFAIHDYEGFGEGLISEYTGLEEVSELAKFIDEHGELGSEVLSHFCGNLIDAKQALEDSYHGEFSNEEDFAYYWVHEVECMEITKYLQNYIDYKAMAHDFFINDFYSIEVNHKVHVFSYH